MISGFDLYWFIPMLMGIFFLFFGYIILHYCYVYWSRSICINVHCFPMIRYAKKNHVFLVKNCWFWPFWRSLLWSLVNKYFCMLIGQDLLLLDSVAQGWSHHIEWSNTRLYVCKEPTWLSFFLYMLYNSTLIRILINWPGSYSKHWPRFPLLWHDGSI